MARTDEAGLDRMDGDEAAGRVTAGKAAPPTAAERGDADQGDDSPAPAEPVLSAFAAAIERKKAAGQARSAHLDGSAKVGGATSNRKTSRTFRRKSG